MNPIPIHDALQARLESASRLPDREQYLGASEIGTCLRHALARKSTPEALDAPSMGRMLAGRALENEVVQLVRLALKGRLRETGRSQRELVHPDLPLRAHPDGRIIGQGDADGLLEVKTASAATFKRYAENGLPIAYDDQVQVQMGLSGLSWALVVLVTRENLSELATFEVVFDPIRYKGLLKRAEEAGRHLQAGTLPVGEPERGYCWSCPFAADCTALRARRERSASGEVPEVLRCQLEAQIEELETLEARLDPLEARARELREQIKQSLQTTGLRKVSLDQATVQFIESLRTSFDAKALLREAPDVHARYLRTVPVTQLRITPRKGELSCPSAS